MCFSSIPKKLNYDPQVNVFESGVQCNRPFHGSFFNFSHGQFRECVDTTEKNALTLVTLPSLKVIC